MKRTLILVLSLLSGMLTFAQSNLDIFTLSGRYSTPQEYDSIYSGKAQEWSGSVGITLPIPVTKKTIIYNSLNYFYFKVNNEPQFPDNIADPIVLHGYIIRTGLVQRFSEGRSIQFLLSPRMMTDMQGGGFDNFQFGVLAMYEKKYSSNFTLGLGAMFNQEFFGPYLVPLVNLNWVLSQHFSITGMFPVYGKIKCHVNDAFVFGISHFGLTTSYGLNNPDYETDYMERQSIDEAFFANLQLSKNIFIEGRVGMSLNRSYYQYDEDQKVDLALPLKTFGDDRTAQNVNFKSGPFVELRLIYSIPIPQE